jgi:hypothetical protein
MIAYVLTAELSSSRRMWSPAKPLEQWRRPPIHIVDRTIIPEFIMISPRITRPYH